MGRLSLLEHRQGIDRVVTIRGARIDDKLIQKGVFWKRNPRENGIIMSSFHILEENYEQYLCKLRSYKPRFIKAYPSAIASLCILMQKHGDKKLNGLKGVICSSETIYDWHRTLVKDTLGVEIYSFSTIQGYPMHGSSEYEIPRIALTDDYWPNLAKIVGIWHVIRRLFKSK